jgi:hypothetical protein
MKNGIRSVVTFAVLLAASSGAATATDRRLWSAAIGLGAVDQDAIGGAPTVSVELAGHPAPAFSLGVRGGYFTKDDCCGEQRDTLYAVLFARARWTRAGVQPFLETGGGRYEFEGHPLEGWFAGGGADIPFSPSRGLLLAARYHSVPRPSGGALPDFAEVQASLHFNF